MNDLLDSQHRAALFEKQSKRNTNFWIQAALPAKIGKANSQHCDKVGCIVYLCY